MPMPPEIGSARMLSAAAADLDVAPVLAAFRGRMERVAPDDIELAMRTVERLLPPRWRLEWQLSSWLGGAFGLDPDLTSELILSSVLGLVAIRLEDDLVDDEVLPADRAGGRRVAALAFEEALLVYRSRLDGQSPFWDYLERSMATWRSAHRPGAGDGPALSVRGAPLKVPAFGACLFGQRLDMWPDLDRCLDLALAAMVRLDQFIDWEADLAAGRWNSFVDSASGLAGSGVQPPAKPPAHSDVLVAALTTDIVADTFQRVAADARSAAALARHAGVEQLATHLDEYAASIVDEGAKINAHYRGATQRMTELMFGSIRNGPAQAQVHGGTV